MLKHRSPMKGTMLTLLIKLAGGGASQSWNL
jgi:hypothetical protein